MVFCGGTIWTILRPVPRYTHGILGLTLSKTSHCNGMCSVVLALVEHYLFPVVALCYTLRMFAYTR